MFFVVVVVFGGLSSKGNFRKYHSCSHTGDKNSSFASGLRCASTRRLTAFSPLESSWDHLDVVGMLRFMSVT